jgi:hypothetical protein
MRYKYTIVSLEAHGHDVHGCQILPSHWLANCYLVNCSRELPRVSSIIPRSLFLHFTINPHTRPKRVTYHCGSRVIVSRVPSDKLASRQLALLNPAFPDQQVQPNTSHIIRPLRTTFRQKTVIAFGGVSRSQTKANGIKIVLIFVTVDLLHFNVCIEFTFFQTALDIDKATMASPEYPKTSTNKLGRLAKRGRLHTSSASKAMREHPH